MTAMYHSAPSYHRRIKQFIEELVSISLGHESRPITCLELYKSTGGIVYCMITLYAESQKPDPSPLLYF